MFATKTPETPETTSARPPKTAELPSPREFPEREVVIFDGQCRFCRGQVENLRRWDTQRKLAFISLHDDFVAEHYPDLDHETLMEEMVVVDRKGRRHGGAAAFRYLTRRLPRLYPLAPLMHLPGSLPLWKWAYRQVAKRRYKLAGKQQDREACEGDSCDVHFR